MEGALFLDRDGVIIENRANYVRTWEDVTFIPSALQALARIRSTLYKIVIVTNQSAIGRGIITHSRADEINQKVCQVIQDHGGRIDAVYVCPHTPLEHCDCRKPNPGLLLQASSDLSIDLSRSCMIGDALDDLEAGERARVLRSILVLTGRGKDQAQLLRAQQLRPDQVCDDLACAIDRLSELLFPQSNASSHSK